MEKLYVKADGTPNGVMITYGRDGPLVEGIRVMDIHLEVGEVPTAKIYADILLDITCFHDKSRKYKAVRIAEEEGGR